MSGKNKVKKTVVAPQEVATPKVKTTTKTKKNV